MAEKPDLSFGISGLQSAERQQVEQAKRNFINATLRRESGASISPEEFKNGEKQYFPAYKDSTEVLKQKEANRARIMQNLLREGGQGNVDPTTITVAPDGSLIRIK